MTKIRCTVETCKFNGNNVCGADMIEVHTEDGERDPINSEHTLCATFRQDS
ncbi:hypothetical protein GGQ84_000046 [Desulfitispora alkaliphila]|uniref:DUF1540 domain-containing protein n=1 Tax=Desulfitispora alkaliphila TaxID=622674 RepID=UPI003D1AC589